MTYIFVLHTESPIPHARTPVYAIVASTSCF